MPYKERLKKAIERKNEKVKYKCPLTTTQQISQSYGYNSQTANWIRAIA